jgi:hypothetical protein
MDTSDQDLMLEGEDIYSEPQMPAALSNEMVVSMVPQYLNFSRVGDVSNSLLNRTQIQLPNLPHILPNMMKLITASTAA